MIYKLGKKWIRDAQEYIRLLLLNV